MKDDYRVFTHLPHAIQHPHWYAGDVIIPQDIHFTEVSGSGGFTLTCISTGGPATTVMWTRDSEILSEGLSTVLENRITAEYTHTLTVAGRLEGVYTCSVSNIKPSSATRELRVEGRD